MALTTFIGFWYCPKYHLVRWLTIFWAIWTCYSETCYKNIVGNTNHFIANVVEWGAEGEGLEPRRIGGGGGGGGGRGEERAGRVIPKVLGTVRKFLQQCVTCGHRSRIVTEAGTLMERGANLELKEQQLGGGGSDPPSHPSPIWYKLHKNLRVLSNCQNLPASLAGQFWQMESTLSY